MVGIDLAGNEAEFSAQPFQDLFSAARQGGLKVTIHAGEWGGAENVRQAIRILGAERIGHGIRVLEDPETVIIARERGIIFEVCVTSNHHSGAVEKLLDHPIRRMLQNGLNVTINTDDPSISRISLSTEYQTIHEEFGMPIADLEKRVLAAVEGAFLEPKLKRLLATKVAADFRQAQL